MSNSQALSQKHTGLGLGGDDPSLVDFVASGTISDAGITVALNTDGTVSAVSSGAEDGAVTGSGYYHLATAILVKVAYDSVNGKVLVVYSGTGGAGTARVGTVTATAITFGTAVEFTPNYASFIALSFNPTAGKFVISWRDSTLANIGKANVATISGTTVSFGTTSTFDTATVSFLDSVSTEDTNQVILFWGELSGSYRNKARVVAISGTSIIFGTTVIVNTNTSSNTYKGITFDTVNSRIVFVYSDWSNGRAGTVRVGSLSVNTITLGTATVFDTTASTYPTAAYSPVDGKVVISYSKGNAGFGLAACTGTVAGNTITFGAIAILTANQITDSATVYDAGRNLFIVACQDYDNSDFGVVVVGQISGTSVVFKEFVYFKSTTLSYLTACYSPTGDRVVIAYTYVNYSNYGQITLYRSGDTNSLKTIGIAQASATDAQTVGVGVKGFLDANQVGLTVNADYYVDSAGTLTTVSTDNIYIGRAKSPTQLFINK